MHCTEIFNFKVELKEKIAGSLTVVFSVGICIRGGGGGEVFDGSVHDLLHGGMQVGRITPENSPIRFPSRETILKM
jgi:hypothetical protein